MPFLLLWERHKAIIRSVFLLSENKRDFYEVLGVDKSASEDEIKKYITKYPKINKDFKLINF